MGIKKIKKIIRKNWDELGIATALGHFVACCSGDIDPDKMYIVEAIRRSRSDLHDADIETIREYVASLDENQIAGFVNNIKGIANEIYYVEAENSDGDTVKAYLFEDTNHPDYDVVLYDDLSGESIDMQLKATDSIDYVNDTIDEVGSENVILTSELAECMGLPDTGISNEKLTADFNTVVDTLIEDHSLWDYVPGLTAWSIALVIVNLAQRYARREISRGQFITMVGAFAGAKAVKVALIIAALSVPSLNIVAGAMLFLKLTNSVRDAYRVDQ